MAAATNRRDLYLTVGGTVDPLKLAMKAGKSEMMEFRDGAVDTVAQVEAAFQKLTSGENLAESRRALEADFNRTFANIRANAAQVLTAPNGASAVAIVNANASRQAAEAAEAQASALKVVADAASRAAASTEGDTTAARQYAAAAAAAYVGAQQFAQGLRDQAVVLSSVESELLAVGVKQQETADRVVTGHNRMGASGMILQHVVRSTNDSLAAGLPVQMIVGEQFGRLSEAMVLYAQTTEQSGTTFGRFAGFMAGPWGLAVSIFATAFVPLIAHLLESGNAVEAETAKLEKNAEQTAATRKAKELFTKSTEGQRAATDDLNEAMGKEIQTSHDVATQAYEEAQAHLNAELRIRGRLSALLALRKEELAATVARATGPGGANSDARALSIAPAQAAVDNVEAQIAKNDAAIAAAELRVGNTLGKVISDQADRDTDPIKRINDLYDQQAEQLRKSIATNAAFQKSLEGLTQAQRGAALAAERRRLQPQFDKIEEERGAALDAYHQRNRKTPRGPSLGSELNAENGAQLLASADRYRGMSETANNGALQALFRQAGMNVDPKMVAWCAAFVNAVLATNGLPGTGSLSSQSFLNYGTKTDRPVKGDIVVVKPDASGRGHVGFFDGTDGRGNVRILGGNTGNKVGDEAVPLSRVAGFRRAPTAGEAEKLAEREAAAARTRDDEMSRAEDRYTRALEQLGETTDDRLATELTRLETAKKARDREIDQELAAGKYGRPETAEAQAEAAKLKRLNATTTELDEEIAVRAKIQADLDKQLDLDRRKISGEIAILQLQEQLATTTRERHRIALLILAKEEEEARKAAQRDIDSNDPARHDRGVEAMKQVDAEHPYKVQQVDRQTADPVQQKMDQLHRNVDDINEAFKGVEADGLQSLEDGLVGIISGTESVGSAFKKMANQIIADLARIYIEKFIVSLVGSLSGGGQIGGGSSGGGGDGYAAGRIPGFALGFGALDDNVIRGPGTGTSDSVLAFLGHGQAIRVSNGESIMTERATRRYGPVLKAMNDNALPGFAAGFIPPTSIAYPKLPDMRTIGSTGGTVQINMPISISAPGADAAALKRVEDSLDQLRAEVPATAIQAVAEAKSRFMLRDVA